MGGQAVATTSATIEEYIEEMRKNLHECDYGRIGLVFTVHENKVTYVREIKERGYQIDES